MVLKLAMSDLLKVLRIGHETSIRGSGISLREAMARADYAGLRQKFGAQDLVTLIEADKVLIEQWLAYSEDKRTSGGWYILSNGEIGQVGQPESRVVFESIEEAIAEYVVRELEFWAKEERSA